MPKIEEWLWYPVASAGALAIHVVSFDALVAISLPAKLGMVNAAAALPALILCIVLTFVGFRRHDVMSDDQGYVIGALFGGVLVPGFGLLHAFWPDGASPDSGRTIDREIFATCLLPIVAFYAMLWLFGDQRLAIGLSIVLLIAQTGALWGGAIQINLNKELPPQLGR